VNDDDATTLLLEPLLLSYAIPSLVHTHTNLPTHTRTHKRKRKFQRTLQNNLDFNTLCKTIATHFAKQKIPIHFACKNKLQRALRNNCHALCESISTDFAKHAGQETGKNGRDPIRSPVRTPNSTTVFLSGSAGNLLLTF
jgi:hypothetical protein